MIIVLKDSMSGKILTSEKFDDECDPVIVDSYFQNWVFENIGGNIEDYFLDLEEVDESDYSDIKALYAEREEDE